MRTPLILLSLLILSLLPGYGMRERTMSSQTGSDTVVFFDRYGTTEPRKINGEIHGNITSLRDPNTPTDSIRMDNYQWAINTKHLTYPEYRRMIYPLKTAIDAAYEPGYDTIYIEPADSRLKVHHAELTVDYSKETKPTPLLKDLRCAGSMSGILGDCKIGEAVAFQLSYSIDYVQLKEKNNIFFTGQTVSIENYDTAVVNVDFELQKPRFSTSDSLFADKDIKHRAINLQGLIRVARQTEEGQAPDTVSYRYNYDFYKDLHRGSIVRCDAD